MSRYIDKFFLRVYNKNMAAIEPIYKEIGELVRLHRRAAGLRQEQVAAMLVPPVTRTSLINVEKGRQRILPHTLYQFAEIFNVAVTAFLPGCVPKPSRRQALERKQEKARAENRRAALRQIQGIEKAHAEGLSRLEKIKQQILDLELVT